MVRVVKSLYFDRKSRINNGRYTDQGIACARLCNRLIIFLRVDHWASCSRRSFDSVLMHSLGGITEHYSHQHEFQQVRGHDFQVTLKRQVSMFARGRKRRVMETSSNCLGPESPSNGNVK